MADVERRQSPYIPKYNVGDQVTVQGTFDPNPYHIHKVYSNSCEYMLMRDGVSDTEIYPEWKLRMLHDLEPRPYYKSTLENLHKSVENVAVGAGSSATPIKEAEVNTADNDTSPHLTLNHHSEASDPDAKPDSESVEGNPAPGAHFSRTPHLAPSKANGPITPLFDSRHTNLEIGNADVMGRPPRRLEREAAAGEDYYLDRRTAAGPSEPTERVLITIRGRELDITDLDLDKDYLDVLPEEIREETLMSRLAIERSKAIAVGEEFTDITRKFLAALPPDIREEFLQQEALDRRPRERENTRRRQQAASGGGGAIAEEMDPASFGESKDQETLRSRRTEFEDSAYGTASHGQSSGVKAALPTDTNAVERPIDDIGTEYSETSMTESRSLGYMEHFANDLYAVISKVQCDPQGIQTLSGLLPELLQQFALRIGHEVPRKDGREVMYYVHKHRKRIAELFERERNSSDWNEVQEDSASQVSETIPVLDKVIDWLKRVDLDSSVPEDAHEPGTGAPEEDGFDDDGFDDDGFDDVGKYKKLVSRTSAYTWLLASMAREIAQTSEESHVLMHIRHKMSRHLPPILKVSPRRPPDTTAIVFQLHWDPMAFMSEQRYSGDPTIVFEQAVTLTGTPRNAQALPCLQYLNQAWPSSGKFVACLIQKLIRVEIGQEVCVRLSDNSRLTAWRSSAVVYVKTSGTRGSIIEVGEQLAWLGAALRSSPYKGIAYCQPQIENGSRTTERYHRSEYTSDRVDAKVLTITFLFGPEDLSAGGQSQGTCWYNLFRNPVVVPGFPVLRRKTHCDGLEVPLNMIAGFLGVRRAHIFSDVVFIKGYSAMLVPSMQSDGLLVWHVFHNADGNRISYLDNDLPPLQDFEFWNLQASRHIVGWCSYAKNYAGGLEANYKIERSRMPLLGQGCVLEKVSINAGKYITAGVNFAIGIKDVPLHLPCKPYVQKLRWVASKSVVLWDVTEERGWLVRGTSALLHLLRASLKHYEMDAFSASLLSKFNDILEPSTGSLGDYTINVLLDERNMKLPIYPEKNEVQLEDDESTTPQDPYRAPKTKRKYYRVEDRVEELYETLERLIDHQIKATGQAGIRMKAHARRRLEGWDFKDLASGEDPIYPHVTTLHALGKGWVDFVRSIQAITLFGSGFGDIIRPSTDIACCYWRQVPRNRFYLAACVRDLQRIMETHGDPAGSPMKVCDDILWYNSSAAFDACECVGSHNSKHSDFVQTLWPISLRSVLPRRPKPALQTEGAVIFGHNVTFKWKWEDTGDPVVGDPDLENITAEDEFHDSGIGVSDTMASGPSDQRLSDEKTSPQYSQTTVSGGLGSENSPARFANLHGNTAPIASIQENAGLKLPSFKDRVKKKFSSQWFAQIQQKKKGRGG